MPGFHDYGGYGGGRGRGGRGGGRGNREFNTDPEAPQNRKLFVGGLSTDTSEEAFKSYFESFGEIEDCVVMKDKETKKSKGFGFVTYATVAQIDEAQKNRPHTIDGREVDTKRSIPKDSGESQKSLTKMFVGGMKDDTTEEQVREVFQEYGTMKSCDVIKDKNTGKCKGFGFIEFEDYDSVDKAVLKKRFELNGKTVEVKKSVPKEEMQGGGRGGRDGGYGGYDGGYGGYGGGYGGGYDPWGGAGGYGDYGYGAGYGGGYGGGAMRPGGYMGKAAGPYGGGYGGGGYGGRR